MGEIRDISAESQCRQDAIMPTTKPKYEARRVVGIKPFIVTEETIQDLRVAMKREPNPRLIAEIQKSVENCIAFAELYQSMPTPAEMRQALKELLQQSREFSTLLHKTDDYTRLRIEEKTGEPFIENAQGAITRLISALRDAQLRIHGENRKGGRLKPTSNQVKRQIEARLRGVFKRETLSRQQLDHCIFAILNSLPGPFRCSE
jgi:hypothetical protein